MKILQIIQKPQLRGAEIFACQLSNHLIEQGHEVLVVTIFKGDSQLPFKGRLIGLDRPLSKRFLDFKGWKKFNRIINEFNPDIIQANAADTLKFAVGSKILYSWKQPLVYRNANKMGDFITSKLKWRLNNFYISRVDYVISVSHNCEDDFKKTFNFPQERITTVPIGTNEFVLSGYIPEDLKHIFEGNKILVNVGSLVPEKNHLGLLQIFRQLKRDFLNTKLVIIGDGTLRKELEKHVEDNGLSSDVFFLGYRNDVVDIIAAADAFVMPSYIEGLPGVILEAFYCKTPVIANNVGGIGEVVRSNNTGWLIGKDKPEDFIRAITECLTNKQKSEIYAENAYKLVTQEYMNSQITQRFVAAYKNLLSKELKK